MFHFQRIVKIHLSIYPITRWSDRVRESTAAIVASVVEKKHGDQVLPRQQHCRDHEQTFTFYTKHVLLVS